MPPCSPATSRDLADIADPGADGLQPQVRWRRAVRFAAGTGMDRRAACMSGEHAEANWSPPRTLTRMTPSALPAAPPASVADKPDRAPARGGRTAPETRPARPAAGPVRRRIGPQAAARGFQALDCRRADRAGRRSGRGAAGGPVLEAELGRTVPFVVGAVGGGGGAAGRRRLRLQSFGAAGRHLLRVLAAFAAAGAAAFGASWLVDGRDERPAVLIWTASAACWSACCTCGPTTSRAAGGGTGA
jgi:hypothetical protein